MNSGPTGPQRQSDSGDAEARSRKAWAVAPRCGAALLAARYHPRGSDALHRPRCHGAKLTDADAHRISSPCHPPGVSDVWIVRRPGPHQGWATMPAAAPVRYPTLAHHIDREKSTTAEFPLPPLCAGGRGDLATTTSPGSGCWPPHRGLLVWVSQDRSEGYAEETIPTAGHDRASPRPPPRSHNVIMFARVQERSALQPSRGGPGFSGRGCPEATPPRSPELFAGDGGCGSTYRSAHQAYIKEARRYFSAKTPTCSSPCWPRSPWPFGPTGVDAGRKRSLARS